MKRRLGFSSASILALTATLTFAGCSGSDDDESPTPTSPTPVETPADEGFSSAISGGNGEPAPEAPSDGDSESGDDGGGERTVEEADILVQEGDNLFILNAYRGLLILDVSNPDKPRVRGRVPLAGYPVEMYVREGRAYIVISNYFYYMQTDVEDSISTFNGSLIAVADVSDPDNPSLLSKIDLEGYVSQTRAVGDVIYAVSTRYSYYSCDGASTDTTDQLNVISIDISNPANPSVVDTLTWPGSWAQVHATPRSFYIVEPDYVVSTPTEPVEEPADGGNSSEDPSSGGGSSSGGAEVPAPPATATPSPDSETPPDDGTPVEDPTTKPDDPVEPGTTNYVTHITYIDISDPGGVMAERGRVDVPGTTYDKFAINEFEDTLRIATQKYDNYTSATLSVLDVSNPDQIEPLATLNVVLPVLEYITATRFDGDRGYLVTAERTDPLFIVDLLDPTNPRLAGQVEMPGQLNHLETLGDRIVAFGQDNSDEGTWKFAVSLFDVTDLDNPSMLDREIIGDGTYSWSAATWDDKAFSVIESQGLIAVPFSAYNADYTYIGGVQLLDLEEDALTARGMVTHEGYVSRVRPVGDRLVSLSDTRLLTFDITNRDKPQVTADVTLAQYVADYLPMGNVGVQLVTTGYYWYGSSNAMGAVRVVNNSNPDEQNEALAEISLPLYDGQLLQLDGSHIGVLRNVYDANYVSTSYLDIFDLSNPSSPEKVSETVLPSPVYSWASSYASYYGSSGGAVVQGEGYLAWLDGYYYYGYPGGVEDVDTARTLPAEDAASYLNVIKLDDFSQPELVRLPLSEYSFGLKAYDATLYWTHSVTYTDEDSGYWYARYYLDTLDVNDVTATSAEDPAFESSLSSVNIPGTFQHVLEDGTVVTLDSAWKSVSDETYGQITYIEYALKGVEIRSGKAYVKGSIPLKGYSYSMLFDGDVAYLVNQPYYWDVVYNECYYTSSVTLDAVKLDFSTSTPQVRSTTMPTYYAYLRSVGRRSGGAGHLFVDGGYGGLMVYSLENPLEPSYESFEYTSGYALKVRVDETQAYVPLGMYGVDTFSLEN